MRQPEARKLEQLKWHTMEFNSFMHCINYQLIIIIWHGLFLPISIERLAPLLLFQSVFCSLHFLYLYLFIVFPFFICFCLHRPILHIERSKCKLKIQNSLEPNEFCGCVCVWIAGFVNNFRFYNESSVLGLGFAGNVSAGENENRSNRRKKNRQFIKNQWNFPRVAIRFRW